MFLFIVIPIALHGMVMGIYLYVTTGYETYVLKQNENGIKKR